jgi:hypothetical protein
MADDDEPDVNFADHDFHYSADPQFDISDTSVKAYQNKALSRIDLVMKTTSRFNAMKQYLTLKAYCFKLELELGIFEEDGGEH